MNMNFEDSNMNDHDFEEAHYYWVLSNVCDLIGRYGYAKVMMDIDRALKNEDLSVEIAQNFNEED